MDFESLYPKAGDPYYYATLWLDDSKQHAVRSIVAWSRLMDRILIEVSDPSVALAKLGFWKNEVAMWFQDDKSNHPVGQTLLPIINKYKLPEESFLEVIDGISVFIEQPNIIEKKHFSLFLLRRFGHQYALLMNIISPLDHHTYKQALDLGEHLGLQEVLIDLDKYYQHGREVLPSEWFIKLGIYEKQFYTSKNGIDQHKLKALLQFASQKSIKNKSVGEEYKAVEVLSVIFSASLNKTPVRLVSPIHQLWYAFKTHIFGSSQA